MDLADPTLFSPARLAHKRPPEPASCESPLPKEREERLPLLWIPPLPPRVQPHVSLESVIKWGLSGLIQGLQGPHQDSQAVCFEIRSTPEVQRNVSDLYSMKVQSEHVRAGSNPLPHSTFILTKSKGLTRAASQSGVERATNPVSATQHGDGPCKSRNDRRDGTCSIRRWTKPH